MPLQTVPSTTPIDTLVQLLERDGAIVVEGLATPAQLDQVHDELSPWLDLPLDQSPLGNDRFKGLRTLRTSSLIAKSPTCRTLATDPLVLQILDRVLGPQCAAYQLSWTQAIRIGPGELAQVPHRDTNMYPFARPGPECFVNTIWAMTPFTADNGGTVVWPGSHRWADGRLPTDADEVTQVEMAPGSVVVYLGSVWHGGGANRTERDRIGVGLAYTLGWLRQEENQYLACPPEVARTLSPQLQRLLGYTGHAPFLGWYEGADPAWARSIAERVSYSTALKGRG
jgi:ectoine hydroxylase-related dioxygenase (phytanoyl-CoA dioxygenase family)